MSNNQSSNQTSRAARERADEVKAAFAEGYSRSETLGGSYPPGQAGIDLAWMESHSRQKLASPMAPNFNCKCGSEKWRLAVTSSNFICSDCFAPANATVPLKARANPRSQTPPDDPLDAPERPHFYGSGL